MLIGEHLDRLVRLEVRDGREVVVKTYRRGGSRDVYDQMRALWLSPFGCERQPPGLPQPLSVDPGTGELVMARAPGRPLAERDDLGDSVPRLREVAALLADLHTSGVTIKRVRSAKRLVASSQRKAADLSAASFGPRPSAAGWAVAEAADRLVGLLGRCCPTDETLVPSHGDFSPRNILGDVSGLVLVDLDRMQMADPAHDLAHWGAWTWATDAINGHVPTWDVLGDLVSHYTAHLGGLPRIAGGSLAFHQAVALLRIVQGWSALQNLPRVQCLLLAEGVRLVDRYTSTTLIPHG